VRRLLLLQRSPYPHLRSADKPPRPRRPRRPKYDLESLLFSFFVLSAQGLESNLPALVISFPLSLIISIPLFLIVLF
jgi:hypothetical protein